MSLINKEAVIIFLKYPELGRAKTRLAKTIGNSNALKVYNELLKHTRLITKNLKADKYLFYDKKSEKKMPWGDEVYFTAYQRGNDLGARMFDAFNQLFEKGYERVVIIGADCYELRQTVIEDAIIALNTNDVTVGPAKDGGYYLLGLKKVIPQLFANVPWSTEQVFKTTTQIFDALKLSYFIGPVLSDVDTFEDLPPELKALLDKF